MTKPEIIALAAAAIALAVVSVQTSTCVVQTQRSTDQFKIECIKAGGTYISGSNCIGKK
jgi:hypothetical protein